MSKELGSLLVIFVLATLMLVALLPIAAASSITAAEPEPLSFPSRPFRDPDPALLVTDVSARAPWAICNVPAGHATIAAALADPTCDPILVAAGTYTENLVVTRTVSVIGAGPGATIVDGNYVDTVFRVETGGIHLRLEGMTIQHGQPAQGEGGGIDNMTVASGFVTVHDCDVRNNAALNGGAISNSSVMTITSSTIYSNTASDWGGGIENLGGTLWISGTAILSNTALLDGGGIDSWDGADVTLINTTLQGNQSGTDGGGIWNNSTVTIVDSTLKGNHVTDDGGGICNYGSLSIVGTTLDGNSAVNGGAIRNGQAETSGYLTIENSTLSGNSATTNGGSILIQDTQSSLTLLHTTIVSNTADADGDTFGDGGGIALVDNATAVISSSILAGNTDLSSSSSDDCAIFSGTVASGGYNLLGSGCTFSATGDVSTTAPHLNPLSDNGGNTHTHVPRYTSPAIDLVPWGTNGCGAAVTDDQRDHARPVHGACDAGAIEVPLQPFTIGDLVWYDIDQDGVQDAGEPGLENITVDLYQDGLCTGTLISSTLTGASGTYSFTVTSEMTTCISVSVPAGWTVSPRDQGGDDALDSDAGASGTITNVQVAAGDSTLDAGLYVAGQVGDRVFCDANANAAYDPGEGLPGVTVTLYDDPACTGDTGTPLSTTVSTADGDYRFTGLESYGPGAWGKCYVTGVDPSDPDLGACVNAVTPITSAFHLNADTSPYLDADFGFEELELGDRVWYDTDQDGIQDAGEPGVQGIGVDLYTDACSGQPLASDTTDASGLYTFSGSRPSTYCLQFSGVPAGWSVSARDQGADDALDSDADPVTRQITGLLFTDTDLAQDMGVYTGGAIGGTVFCDADSDDVYDAGEGVAGVTVDLYDDPGCDGIAAALMATQDTVSDGQYRFTDVPAGPPGSVNLCYVVEVDAVGMGDCSSPFTPLSYTLSLQANAPDDLANDFGFREPTAVSLLYFTAGRIGSTRVELKWATAAEVDVFGFKLYRSATANQGQAQVVAFIPPLGSDSTYAHIDTLPAPGRWWYWLSDIDTFGVETFHGPVAVDTKFQYIYLPLLARR